jgi:Kef-type K+ transport system membrane component KefB
VLFRLLLALAAVIIVGRLLRPIFRAIGQPPVIGEVIAGIVLGPSLLGRVAPEAYRYLLPPEVAPLLGTVAQFGVVTYMFLVGLEVNPREARPHLHSTMSTAFGGIVVPFALGSLLAFYLYPRFSTTDIPFANFALFVGVAMSITAFPVLARILSDTKMSKSAIGVHALTCAAVNDIAAWCLLAVIVGIVHVTSSSVLVVAAFLVGAAIPHNSGLARALGGRFEWLVIVALLPAFFAFTGMRTQIHLVSGWSEWAAVALIIAVATAGKFGGALLGARVSGLDWRTAAALGILMNTRGLMELIVLNLGLDLGIISIKLYTMMVLMALATTIATTPMLRLVLPATALSGQTQSDTALRSTRAAQNRTR